MFCPKCGNSIESNQCFCSKCGNRIQYDQNSNINVDSSQVNDHLYPKKKNAKKIIVGAGITVSIILVVCIVCVIISNIGPKRVDFDLKYDSVEIQQFMNMVCKNSKVESAQVEEVEYNSYINYYLVTLTVKPSGMVAEEIQVEFYNSGETDKVSSIVISYHDYDSENKIKCKDAVVEALEVSFCGSSKAREYISDFSSMHTEPASYDTKLVTDYSLTNNAQVIITWKEEMGSPMFEWTGKYIIKIVKC